MSDVQELKNFIDDTLNQKINLLHSRIDSAVNNIITQMEEVKDPGELSLYQLPESLVEKLSKPAAPPDDDKVTFIHQYIKNISSSVNQLNLITNFLEGINHFCTRAALFLLRDDKLVGWKGKGFSNVEGGIGDEEIKKIFFSLSANTIFKYVLDKRTNYSGPAGAQPDDHLIFSRMGGSTPEKIFVLPFFVKGKPQAIVYTDSFQGKPIGEKEIEMLSIVGEMSLDLLPLRQKILSRVKTKEFSDTEAEPPKPSTDPTTTSAAIVQQPQGSDEQTVPSIKENDPERLARVIINDIVLYNKTMVEDGLTHKNLYSVLQDTILQARELYLNKFSDLSPFERQLVDNLARGDREALRGYKFETV